MLFSTISEIGIQTLKLNFNQSSKIIKTQSEKKFCTKINNYLFSILNNYSFWKKISIPEEKYFPFENMFFY